MDWKGVLKSESLLRDKYQSEMAAASVSWSILLKASAAAGKRLSSL